MKRLLLSLIGTLALIGTYASTTANAVTYNPKGYTLQFHSSAAATTVDATTYFIGSLFDTPMSTTATLNEIDIPRGGVVRAVYLIVVSGTGTNETSTASFRLNNTTDTTISASVISSAAVNKFNNTTLSVPVVAGDFFEIKWVTPTWATNPTNVWVSGSVYVEVP